MKLTIPSMKNLKQREAFLFAHPDYYSESRLKAELLKIAIIRKTKNLRWPRPQMSMPQEQGTETKFTMIPKKTSLIDKVKNLFTKG